MEIKHLKVTTVRPFSIFKTNELGKKIQHIGYELIGRYRTGKKLKLETDMLMTLPFINEEAQRRALLENLRQILVIEDKKQELFYKNIQDGKI